MRDAGLQGRRDLFQRKARLEKRWRRGQHQKTSFQAHPHAVNGIKFLSTDHAPQLPAPVAKGVSLALQADRLFAHSFNHW